MKLDKLIVKNFRCFGSEPTIIKFDKLTSFVGSNSSGKTALINAILKLFGESAYYRNLSRSDFHIPKGISPHDIRENDLYIETVFVFPELETDKSSPSIPIFFRNFVVDDVGLPPYLRIRLEATWKDSSSPDGSIETKIYYITTSDDEVDEDDKKPASRHDLDNIKMIYVPALRNPTEQLKNVSGTILSRVLKGINWSDKTKEKLKESLGQVDATFDEEEGVDILKKAIKTQWKNYHTDYRYTDASLMFNGTDLDTILKRVEVKFSPTETIRDYNVEELGDGLRSLFYLSLVNSLLEIENVIARKLGKGTEEDNLAFNIIPPVLTIVAVEEPENHISPQLLGKVINNLKYISSKDNAQTILTSHAPAVIKRIEPEFIRYFRICKVDLCSKVRSITLPKPKSKSELGDIYKYVKEAVQSYPEIYFSRLVVLGEGDSEEIILPKLIELLGSDIDSCNISIVPLGGRHVNHFWRLLNDLQIPHITLLDLDRERNSGGWGRIKYVLKQLIKVGKDEEELLALEGGKYLSYEKLEKMHNWDVYKTQIMDTWIEFLEGYNVFFSYPLDIDFMMLESFGGLYKSMLTDKEGPYIKGKGRIIDIEQDEPAAVEYMERIESDIKATLKAEGGDGGTYSEKQRALMVWYNYFFLNRGKPSTHNIALSYLTREELNANLPKPFKNILSQIEKLLKDDPYSIVGDFNEDE